MTKYNFDKVIDRHNSSSIKWDLYAEQVLPLWVADMDIQTPAEVISAMEARLEHPYFGYQSDDPELLDVICSWVKSHYNWSIKPEDIMLIPGVVSGFNWVAGTCVGQNQAIAFQTPVYFPFYKIAENAGIKQIEIPLLKNSNRYEIDFALFEQLISENVKMFLLCNPHNPVGRVFTEEELRELGKICLKHNVLICSDEIHCDLIFSGNKHISIASLSEDLANSTVTLMAPSKTFNIPGLQFSFAICPNEKMREQLMKNRHGILEEPNIMARTAAKAAYQKGSDWLKQLLVYLEDNRDFVVDFISENLPEIKINPPEGTYLAWMDCSELNLPMSPFEFFLKNAKVALNNGKMFGEKSEQFVRLNFATPRSILEQALDRMVEAVRLYRN